MDHVDFPIRVRYADTDKMGVVYYGTYPMYFEVGRSEYMREKGFSYRSFEDSGYFLAVSQIEIKYYNSALYDDLITVRTSISDVQSRGVTFNYTIFRDGVTLVKGKTRHICLNAEKKTTRIPASLLQILRNDGSA